MATKKDINAWLKRENITMAEVDVLWDELKETNTIAKMLTRQGQTWRDLNIKAIEKIPTQKERDLEFLVQKEKKEHELLEKEEQAKKDREYYQNNFQQLMIEKIDKKEELTESEVRTLVWEYSHEVERGENRRWSSTVLNLMEYNGRNFIIKWEEGLTEHQEDIFCMQPYEVEKVTTQKTIDVIECKKI
jgi:hypothetical protein